MEIFQRSNSFGFLERRHVSGFSLVEMAVVLLIVSLLAASIVGSSLGLIDSKSIGADRTKLSAIEAAIASFVAVNGRLPCPADGRLPTIFPTNPADAFDVSVGMEVRDANGDCTTTAAPTSTMVAGFTGAMDDQKYGVVPWTTLGMGEADVSDSSGHRITYRVAHGLARNSAMNFTACDPAGSGSANTSATSTTLCTGACLSICLTTCVATDMTLCTPPLAVLPTGRGITVRNALLPDSAVSPFSFALMSNAASPTQGAAFVLISHGKKGGGAFTQGAGIFTPITIEGTSEQQNQNNQVATGWYAIDTEHMGSDNEVTAIAHFDDLILRPSIMKIVDMAQRGPRAH